MQNNHKLNSQVSIKDNLDPNNDYILMTAQDKNIQKDYIIQGQELLNLISNQVQQQVFANIKGTNSTVITKNGNSIWVTYDDSTLRELIVRNAQQVDEIARIYGEFDPTDIVSEQVAYQLQNTNQEIQQLSAKVDDFKVTLQTAEDLLQQIQDLDLATTLAALQTSINALDNSLQAISDDVQNLKNTVNTATLTEIKKYYDDALNYVDQQIEFSQTTIGTFR